MDTWLDAFCASDRHSLDTAQICTRAFRRLIEDRLATTNLRTFSHVRLEVLTGQDWKFPAAFLEPSEKGRTKFDAYGISDRPLEDFAARLEQALSPARIYHLTLITSKWNDKLAAFTDALRSTWERFQVGVGHEDVPVFGAPVEVPMCRYEREKLIFFGFLNFRYRPRRKDNSQSIYHVWRT